MSAESERIVENRTAEVELALAGADGKPLAEQPVTIRQVRHRFLFGCNAFEIKPGDASADQSAYRKQFADLLNFATLPFYWGAYEREPGRPDAERLAGMAAWCAENHIRTKGHPLCWHNTFPAWAMERTVDEVHALQLERIRREVAAFAGQIDTWDVVNEAVAMPEYTATPNQITPLCRQIGLVELIRQTFEAARAVNAGATLLLNDYDHTAQCEKLIAECLDAGVAIDVIGIQSHMHLGYFGDEEIWDVCERFARFGKPLHWTEATLISGDAKPDMQWMASYDDWPSTPEGERRQAEQVRRFYTTLFSHPAVEAITWWDLRDGCWLGAPAGLLRADMTPKPAYEELLKLVKGEWWTGPLELATDAGGVVRFRGFLGDYVIDSAGAGGEFRLDRPGSQRQDLAPA